MTHVYGAKVVDTGRAHRVRQTGKTPTKTLDRDTVTSCYNKQSTKLKSEVSEPLPGLSMVTDYDLTGLGCVLIIWGA